MKSIKYIHGETLTEALSKKYRLYLCGNLKLPQTELSCFSDDNLEFGISSYDKFTADIPHFHNANAEYNFILQGCTKVLLVDENIEHTFNSGSFFIIEPNVKYASKHQPNTKIVFVKYPPGNDKQTFKMTASLNSWLSKWE